MYQLSHMSLFSTSKTAFTCLITKSLKPIITCSMCFYNQIFFFSFKLKRCFIIQKVEVSLLDIVQKRRCCRMLKEQEMCRSASLGRRQQRINRDIKCSSLFTHLCECCNRGHHRASTLTVLPSRNTILKANDTFLGGFSILTDLEGRK